MPELFPPPIPDFAEKAEWSAQNSRATVAEISLQALRHNVQATRERVGKAQIMGIIKANAYGHGMLPIAQEMVRFGVEQLGVAFVEEGIALRRAGLSVPILVLGGIIGEQVEEFIEHDLMITASSHHKLEQIEAAARKLGRKAKIHVKIDTGMGRLGVRDSNAPALFEAVTRSRWCELCGVFSHLASSQNPDDALTREQTERFEAATQWFQKRGEAMPLRHLANSGGVLGHPDTVFDMVRPGLMLYGLYPGAQTPRTVALEPVLALKTRVVYFKVVFKGTPVGYDGTWTAPRDTRIVTLPVGYGDGYRRSLSNRGEVLIGGRRCPIVGVVSMDQTLVDIGPDGEAYNDDEVVLLGRQGAEEISAPEMAKWMDTISYELLTGLNTRVPRIYV